jgi:hypothetical protein
VDYADTKLESGIAALCDLAGRPRAAECAGIAETKKRLRNKQKIRNRPPRRTARQKAKTTEYQLTDNSNTKKNYRRWKSGNPKPGFPLFHRLECLRRKEKEMPFTQSN